MGFDAANEADKAIMLWRAEIKQLENDLRAKEQIEARVIDLYRNNDLMRGLVEKMVDTVIGNKVILQAIPDYEGLNVSREDALEWAKIVEREFHNYVDSPENWVSADRSMNFTQMCRQAYRSKIFTGEITASREWRASPLGYKTCFNVFSPSRIKTPSQNTTAWFGIELDRYGEAKAYHVEKAQTLNDNQTYGQRESQKILKRNKYGWLQLVHIYEPFLPEYPRGISRLACVLKKMKQLDRFHEADLDKAIITTAYVFAITSDEDPETVADILAGVGGGSNDLSLSGDSDTPADKKAHRDEIYNDMLKSRFVEFTGGNIMHLFQGEDIKTVAPPNTITTSDEFAKGHTKSVANGMGISYELGTGDFKGISFSGGQLSLGIYEHSAKIERELYAYKFATMVYRAWLDEAMDKGTVPTLGSADYWPNRDKYAKCMFTGARRVHVDPVKASRSNQINLKNGTTSRTDIINENGGDIESVAINRSHEARTMVESIESTAQSMGLELNDSAKLQILTEYITGQSIAVPDEPLEIEDDTAE